MEEIERQKYRKALSVALDGDDWTEGEKKILEWQVGMLGGFFSALIEVMCRADTVNLSKLTRSYPSLGVAVLAWQQGDLFERLKKAGLMS